MALLLGAPALASAAFRYFDPKKPAEVPKLLSQTGFYANLANRTADTAAKPFTVNSPLWSDGTVKKRWVILRPGRKIAWTDDTDLFDYPDSTVFVKTFLQVRGPGDTIYWETRFFVRKANPAPDSQNWWGFSYRWNAAQTDANLVSPDSGADAVLSVRDAQGRMTYRKWRFPSQVDCNQCHQVKSGPTVPLLQGRAVLGFFPAQLKRPTQGGAGNQVLDLFASGVFSGTPPTTAALSRRFIGMSEPLPAANDPGRAAVVDNMARAYLAANCSGCHGDRAKAIGASAARVPPNFDYFDLRHHDLAFNQIEATGDELKDPTPHTDPLSPMSLRNKYKWLVSAWGLGSDPNWDLALPPGNPDTMGIKEIYYDPVTNRGYPALSKALYRQWARNTPAMDSAELYQVLKRDSTWGDAAAATRLRVLFAKPWGSQAWLNDLTANGLTLDSVMSGWQDLNRYRNDGDGMPPLATFIPDTAALRILGEWAVKQPPVTGIRAHGAPGFPNPYLRGRILIAPPGWTGKVEMLDVRGRVFALESLGGGRYAMPPAAKAGVYFFKFGSRTFKTSLLR